MSDDRIISFIWILGGLVLVSAAIVRRGDGGRGKMRLALIWLGIILAAWGVATIATKLFQ